MMSDSDPRPMKELVDEFLEWMQVTNFSPRTIEGRQVYLRAFCAWCEERDLVYAVEITEPFLDYIQKTCREQGIENVVCVHSKVDSAELQPESIDRAFLCDTYHHFEYPFKMLGSIHRALRPGGRLFIGDYRKQEGVSPSWVFGHVRADKKTVIEECGKAGFKFLDEVDLMKIHYLIRLEKPTTTAAGQ